MELFTRPEALAAALPELGQPLWLPPERLHQRMRNDRARTFWLLTSGKLFVIAWLGFFFFLMIILGDLLAAAGDLLVASFLAAIWFPDMEAELWVPLGVYSGGVATPFSFQSTPGMRKFTGPAVIRRGEIAKVERVEEGDYLALVVYTEFGGGIVGPKMMRHELPPETVRSVVDGFERALAQLGVATRRVSPAESEAGGPTAVAA